MWRCAILVQLLGAVSAWKCCFTQWGDATTCADYPSGAHGGLCNTDRKTKCTMKTNCGAVPPSPSPAPGPPAPPSPSPPKPPSPTTPATVYQDAVFDVAVTHDVTYAQGLACAGDQYDASGCKPMDLKLDIYEPKAKAGGPALPTFKPAYVLMHGGGNVNGAKGGLFIYVARWWASRGFVVFDIDYRLAANKGLLPPKGKTGLLEWTPFWPSLYPATRDAKAAIRFVRANAGAYGVDSARIVSSGGSAGATDMLAAGVGFEADFKEELTEAEDPTLASTNMNFSSAVQCLVLHWPSDGGVLMAQQHYPGLGDRYRADNPPVIDFHGDKDTTIPIEHTYAVQTAYGKTGVPFHLHVLTGCPHGSWCYDGKGGCLCSGGHARSPLMEELAFPTVVQSLSLTVVNSSSTIVV